MSHQDSPDVYKPPRADLTERGSGPGKLYSPGQVALAAFLGTPMAGCWLLAQNFTVLGNPGAQRRALIGGVLGTLALIGVALLLPASVPNSVLPIAYTFGLRELAKSLQGAAFAAHLAAGRQKQSSWRAAGIGLLGFAVILGAVAVSVFLLPDDAIPVAWL